MDISLHNPKKITSIKSKPQYNSTKSNFPSGFPHYIVAEDHILLNHNTDYIEGDTVKMYPAINSGGPHYLIAEEYPYYGIAGERLKVGDIVIMGSDDVVKKV